MNVAKSPWKHHHRMLARPRHAAHDSARDAMNAEHRVRGSADANVEGRMVMSPLTCSRLTSIERAFLRRAQRGVVIRRFILGRAARSEGGERESADGTSARQASLIEVPSGGVACRRGRLNTAGVDRSFRPAPTARTGAASSGRCARFAGLDVEVEHHGDAGVAMVAATSTSSRGRAGVDAGQAEAGAARGRCRGREPLPWVAARPREMPSRTWSRRRRPKRSMTWRPRSMPSVPKRKVGTSSCGEVQRPACGPSRRGGCRSGRPGRRTWRS